MFFYTERIEETERIIAGRIKIEQVGCDTTKIDIQLLEYEEKLKHHIRPAENDGQIKNHRHSKIDPNFKTQNSDEKTRRKILVHSLKWFELKKKSSLFSQMKKIQSLNVLKICIPYEKIAIYVTKTVKKIIFTRLLMTLKGFVHAF